MLEPRQQTTSDSKPPRAARFDKPVSFYIALTLAAATVVLLGVFCFMWLSDDSSTSTRDPNAALGQLEGKSPEEIQAELDRIVEEGMFNISITSAVEFENGTSEGDIRIENTPGNRYLMKVEISRDDTGDVVYTSGMIEPNHHIQRARLDVNLPAGSYPCTAVFYAHDMETEELIGQAAAKLTITVLN